MASSGTLAIKVVKLDAVHAEDETHKHFSIKVRIGSESKATKHFHAEQPVNETLNFDLTDVTSADDVHFEAFEKDRTKKAKASWKLHLADFFKSEPVLKALKEHNGNVVHIESKWTPKTTTQKIAGEQTAKTVETAKQVVTLHPQRALAIHDTQRPWFLRVSYYYDTTKNVYNYTTSFRVIAPVARFGENTANTILAKVTGKTLADLDTALVTPNLNSLDQVVDQTIQTVFVKLVEGQSYVLQKKNDAVSTASVVVGSTLEKAGKVKDYTTSSVKSVATTGYNTVASVADYTTSSVKSVASTSYNTVASVADYTTTQVTNVSSSAYGKVRGATVYVVSHVPYLGTKIRA